MDDGLVNALEKVHLDSIALDNREDWIDNVLDEQLLHKKVRQDPEEFKRQLEQKYLVPPTSFSTEWLNRLQQ
jgi:antiviral helicase SKI2